MTTEQALVLALQKKLEATRAQLDTLQKEHQWMRQEYESLQEETRDYELQVYLCTRCHLWVYDDCWKRWSMTCELCVETYCY